MRKRLIGLLAVGVIAASACTSTSATPTSKASGPGPGASGALDLTTTNYRPEAVGHTGGKLVLGEWQEPATAWFAEYDNAATEVEALVVSPDLV